MWWDAPENTVEVFVFDYSPGAISFTIDMADGRVEAKLRVSENIRYFGFLKYFVRDQLPVLGKVWCDLHHNVKLDTYDLVGGWELKGSPHCKWHGKLKPMPGELQVVV